uniref:Uncharacterized protein n=1 Tax=Triticum aestivum TaxID=4565 RepID=A0A077RX54_WHEAT|nr:unnamed protein product [Triticum aestivum]
MVSINKADIVEPADEIDPPMDPSHALAVDNCVDANPAMEKSISPSRPTNERQGAEAEEIENLHVQIRPLKCKLNKVPYYRSIRDERQQVEVYRRLSRYYTQAHELPSPGEEPDNAQLGKELERCLDAYEINFLQRAKDNPEWYFHPEQCKLAGLEDYQRLVLRDHGMYGDLKQYRLYYHTYQGDVEYVQFREQMAEQIKWIDNEAALFGDQEHLYSLRFDFNHRKDLDGVYLEIWKRVARNKMNFGDALKQLYEENIFPFRRPDIKLALDSYPGPSWINSSYDTYVAGIDEGFSEDEAHPLIIEAVEKMVEKRKNYLDYTRKKLEIAARIGLKTSSLEVTAQGGENHGDGKAAIGTHFGADVFVFPPVSARVQFTLAPLEQIDTAILLCCYVITIIHFQYGDLITKYSKHH